MRAHEVRIRAAIESTERDITGTIYRPFQISDKQPLRATQHYLTKLPLAVVLEVPELLAAADQAGNGAAAAMSSPSLVPEAPHEGEVLGQSYVAAAEHVSTAERDPFKIDPSVIDRGVQGHAMTQNALATVLRRRGLEPRSPQGREPQYDLAWIYGDQVNVVEVKSLTVGNEERQLRLGLGQVLRYRQVLSNGPESVRAVLAVERAPSDLSWRDLCSNLDVLLCWPPDFEGL
ncbi:hypothetical protein [Actinopolymorpha singaporensis]|uniref:hypothetical protein n=1 Tax=Actinopolymorpha singaporensis TaxID=117157 RepID=UPI001A7E09C9|nr:hypothetical protein [Actinopolymorpha singaporensis]